MMRFTQLLWVGLGALFVVPAYSQKNGAPRGEGLESAIRETAGVLQELGALQSSLATGDARAIARLYELTEPPVLDAPERDRLLAELRVAVSALQMQVDSGQTATPHATPWTGGRTPGTTPLDLHALGRAPILGPGAELASTPASGGGAASAPAAAPSAGADGAREPAPKAIEPAGYTADPVRAARLLILAGRPQDALATLEHAGDAADVRYWRARSFEKLGRIDESIEAYRAVASDAQSGVLADRARQDCEFLEWKRDFDRRGGTSGGEKP